jgi:uncharacterized protein YdiU (UPF0061 family)
VFSSIDERGRYAYGAQPGIGLWNLTRLAECLIPLISEDEDQAVAAAEAALSRFAPAFEAASVEGYRRKLGLTTRQDEDVSLIAELLALMAENRADNTLTFRRLGAYADGSRPDAMGVLFENPAGFAAWGERYRARLEAEEGDSAERRAAMDAANPVIIPRNHRVEEVIAAAVEEGDMAPFQRLHEALKTPFAREADDSPYASPPPGDFGPYRTFCGT